MFSILVCSIYFSVRIKGVVIHIICLQALVLIAGLIARLQCRASANYIGDDAGISRRLAKIWAGAKCQQYPVIGALPLPVQVYLTRPRYCRNVDWCKWNCVFGIAANGVVVINRVPGPYPETHFTPINTNW